MGLVSVIFLKIFFSRLENSLILRSGKSGYLFRQVSIANSRKIRNEQSDFFNLHLYCYPEIAKTLDVERHRSIFDVFVLLNMESTSHNIYY
jgi:hypothetical protein